MARDGGWRRTGRGSAPRVRVRRYTGPGGEARRAENDEGGGTASGTSEPLSLQGAPLPTAPAAAGWLAWTGRAHPGWPLLVAICQNDVIRSSEEDTSFADADSFATMSSTGVFQKDITGLKEIVRFKYEFDAGDASDATVHILMQAPSWRPY